MKFKSRGFTLIELLIVIGIISLLMTVGVSIYSFAQKKSHDAKRRADLENIRIALESYRSNDANGNYPSATNWQTAQTALKNGGYISSDFNDPLSKVYKYEYTSSGSEYVLFSYLELKDTTCGSSPPNCGVSGTFTCNYCIGPYGKK